MSRNRAGSCGGTRDRDGAGLESLAHRFAHAAIELRLLIEKQHAVMRETDLAGTDLQPAANDGSAEAD